MIGLRAALAFCVLTTLPACSPQVDEVQGDSIACAIGPAGKMEQSCWLEWIGRGETMELVVHHPDGGFRRLELASDGRSFSPSDGADRAISAVTPDAVELTIGPDRYHIPFAMLKPANDQ